MDPVINSIKSIRLASSFDGLISAPRNGSISDHTTGMNDNINNINNLNNLNNINNLNNDNNIKYEETRVIKSSEVNEIDTLEDQRKRILHPKKVEDYNSTIKEKENKHSSRSNNNNIQRRRENNNNNFYEYHSQPHLEYVPGSPMRDRRLRIRNPRRRAVVVGVTYALSGDVTLDGASNDAYLFALTLINVFEFHPNDIVLLTDRLPDNIFLPTDEKANEGLRTDASRNPLRVNITNSICWLAQDAQPGDILVFYFAGHGLQIDNMSGWEGEGYDEAILPVDCLQYGAEVNAITCPLLRQIFLSIKAPVQLTIFLDCNGGQTMLDPSGVLSSWGYIKGVKQKGIWPFVTDPTNKVERAGYNSKAWLHPKMRDKNCRPRFVPGAEVSNTADLIDPQLSKNQMSISSAVSGFMYAAAEWGSCAVEAMLPSIPLKSISPLGVVYRETVLPKGKPIIHGVFTWCLVQAMQNCVISSLKRTSTKRVTVEHLFAALQMRIRMAITEIGLPYLDQKCALTYYKSSGSKVTDSLFWSRGGRLHEPYNSITNPSLVKRRVWPYLPATSEFMSAHQAEMALNYFSGRCRPGRYLSPLNSAFFSTRLSGGILVKKQSQEISVGNQRTPEPRKRRLNVNENQETRLGSVHGRSQPEVFEYRPATPLLQDFEVH